MAGGTKRSSPNNNLALGCLCSSVVHQVLHRLGEELLERGAVPSNQQHALRIECGGKIGHKQPLHMCAAVNSRTADTIHGRALPTCLQHYSAITRFQSVARERLAKCLCQVALIGKKAVLTKNKAKMSKNHLAIASPLNAIPPKKPSRQPAPHSP